MTRTETADPQTRRYPDCKGKGRTEAKLRWRGGRYIPDEVIQCKRCNTTGQIPPKIVECPNCDGRGKVRGQPHSRSFRGTGRELVTCERCNGRGKVTRLSVEWFILGQAMRRNRADRRLTLRQEAKRRGMRYEVLWEMEQGGIEPIPDPEMAVVPIELAPDTPAPQAVYPCKGCTEDGYTEMNCHPAEDLRWWDGRCYEYQGDELVNNSKVEPGWYCGPCLPNLSRVSPPDGCFGPTLAKHLVIATGSAGLTGENPISAG